MINIEISKELLKGAPFYKCLQIECEVENSETSEKLSSLIADYCQKLQSEIEIPDIKLRPAISGTRKAYKAFGKDPNRYRPSAEALCRRALQSKGLYTINTLVDVINLISLYTGYSIGGFDIDKIDGDKLILGVGKHDEPFEAIGRGVLNIEGLPVFRDARGGIGTPTSDHERTKLSLDTRHLLMTVNIYEEDLSPESTIVYIKKIFQNFVKFKSFEYKVIK